MAAVTPSMRRTPLIAGNWKMNLDHLQAIAFVQKLAWSLKDADHDFTRVEVAVFPPFTDLRSVQTLVAADKLPLAFGAQDVSEHESGAYTGEISADFLAKLECRYVIVGHSERRMLHGETDAQVSAKVNAALKHDLTPVICVGETAEDRETHGPSAVSTTRRTTRWSMPRPVGSSTPRWSPSCAWARGSTFARRGARSSTRWGSSTARWPG